MACLHFSLSSINHPSTRLHVYFFCNTTPILRHRFLRPLSTHRPRPPDPRLGAPRVGGLQQHPVSDEGDDVTGTEQDQGRLAFRHRHIARGLLVIACSRRYVAFATGAGGAWCDDDGSVSPVRTCHGGGMQDGDVRTVGLLRTGGLGLSPERSRCDAPGRASFTVKGTGKNTLSMLILAIRTLCFFKIAISDTEQIVMASLTKSTVLPLTFPLIRAFKVRSFANKSILSVILISYNSNKSSN